MSGLSETIQKLTGKVRLRQLADRLRHRLSFVPGMYVLGGIVLAQITLLLDRSLTGEDIPDVLATTVESARSVFTAIAGGLITAITLVLSMMLITVQLASSQFSPRTLRDWLGDQRLKHTVGIALGTTVFSLLGIRSARNFGESGGETVPHSSVIVAVILGVIALFGVVRSVDHITQSLQVGNVARRIADDTRRVIERGAELHVGQDPRITPSTGSPTAVDDGRDDVDIPDEAEPVVAPTSGWIQQVDADMIVDALPERTTGFVVVPLGGFVPVGTPLIWLAPPPPEDHPCRSELLEAFALGRTRTMQQDVGFGIVQLTDIAVRALSPGVNDPTTATDVIVHLGDLMLSLWEQPAAEPRLERDGRTLVRRRVRHDEHVRRAFDPIRRYGAEEPAVMLGMLQTLRLVHSEAERRQLVGPLEPIEDLIADIASSARTGMWSKREMTELEELSRLATP